MSAILIVLIAILAGCAPASIERAISVQIECKDCKTPYGLGEDISFTMDKYLKVIR